MKLSRTLILVLLGSVSSLPVWAVTAHIDTSDYQPIIERNPFGLKPPAPAVDPSTLTNNTPPPAPTTIKFTGLYKMRGVRKACLAVQTDATAAKGATATAPQVSYMSLAVNEKQDDIEMMEIDEKAETIKIKQRGSPMVLNFKDNSYKQPVGAATAPGAPAPGAIPPPPVMPAGGANPTPQPFQMDPALRRRYGLQPSARNNYQPNGADGAVGMGGGAIGNGLLGSAQADASPVIPTRNVRTVDLQPQQTGGLEPAQQYLQTMTQKIAMERQGIPMPPLPPVQGVPAIPGLTDGQ